MHTITELPAWERLLKRIVWEQLGETAGKRILDFGSGEGITANHFADRNSERSRFFTICFLQKRNRRLLHFDEAASA